MWTRNRGRDICRERVRPNYLFKLGWTSCKLWLVNRSFCILILNKDENVHRFAYNKRGTFGERKRERERDSFGYYIIHERERKRETDRDRGRERESNK